MSACALVAASACAEPRGEVLSDATSLTTADTGLSESCPSDATAVAFELANVGDSTVYLQSVGQFDMLSFSNETMALPGGDCGQCSCEDCPGCAVCAGGLPAQILALAPGDIAMASWTGLYSPLLEVGAPGNACADYPCQDTCAAPAGEVAVSVAWSTWFSAIQPPSLIRQGATPAGTSFAHPVTPLVRIDIDSPPPPDVTPSFSASLPGGAFEGAHVVASHNPSDPGGIEIIALDADDRYVALFAPDAAGAHPLMTGTLWRRAVVGTNGGFEFVDTTEGMVTIDAIDQTQVAGSFDFVLPAGTVTGTFVAAFAS